MKLPLTLGFRVFHSGLLRTASLFVPGFERREWLREWRNEYWYARRESLSSSGIQWAAERELTGFCRGAFADALCVRGSSVRSHDPQPTRRGSARECVLWLSAAVVLAMVVNRLLPNVQAEMDSANYHVRSGLAIIQDARFAGTSMPTISLEDFRGWRTSHQKSFDGFAFYRTDREPAPAVIDDASQWTVAHATGNLFALLGLPILLAAPDAGPDRDVPTMVLSYRAWRRDFNGDPEIAGRVVRVGGRDVRVAGVVPYGSWRMPGDPDAWVLSSGVALTEGSPAMRGYMIAHLTERPGSEFFNGRTEITGQRPNESDIDLAVIAFEPHDGGPWGIFKFALLLALLALPAVTSVTMNESSISHHRPSFKRQMARWLFLAAKFGLVVMLAGFASLNIAYVAATTWSPLSEMVQLVACFAFCLAGLRWVLTDQQKRCPVCLRCVTHPAQVGLASRTFLGWNGTEMVCLGGHTLLHIPSLPTSWFGAPRWLYLDQSWDFLFVEPGIG